jgi:hypothetical protein
MVTLPQISDIKRQSLRRIYEDQGKIYAISQLGAWYAELGLAERKRLVEQLAKQGKWSR